MEPTLLLVEDDWRQREAIAQAALVVGPVRVVELANCSEALAYVGANAEELARSRAVMFLDLDLERESGLHTLRSLRKNPAVRRMPVIIFTSSMERADLFLSYEFGANAYVVKPPTDEGLRQVAMRAASFWLHVAVHPAAFG